MSCEKVGVSRSRREMRSPTKPTHDKEEGQETVLVHRDKRTIPSASSSSASESAKETVLFPDEHEENDELID